jgi:hypothetical protein
MKLTSWLRARASRSPRSQNQSEVDLDPGLVYTGTEIPILPRLTQRYRKLTSFGRSGPAAVPRSYRRRSISLIFRMDTFSWGTKSPPPASGGTSVPGCPASLPDEVFFRKPFRHVNNHYDSDLLLIHFPPESLFTFFRNAPFTSPGIRRRSTV